MFHFSESGASTKPPSTVKGATLSRIADLKFPDADADGRVMRKTRLDPLEKIRNAAELDARRRLSTANGELASAQQARERAANDVTSAPMPIGHAWMIDALDRAQTVNLARLRVAEAVVEEKTSAAEHARVAQLNAYRAARVISRINEERRATMVKEDQRKEQKAFDEIALR